MKKSRREFIKQTGMAAAAVAATGALNPARSFGGILSAKEVELPQDDVVRGLMMTAINTAKSAGASYSDVRIGRYRTSIVFTREQQIVNTADVDTMGAGVRALVDGTWGFGATKNLTTDGVASAAREAVAIAKANRIARDQPVQLTPVQSYPNATWKSSFKIDPFTIPIEQRADLLLKANAEALKVKGVKFVNSGLLFVKEDRNFASTEGSVISQTIVRVAVPFTITAVAPDNSDFQTRSNVVAPAGRGWEYVLDQDLVGNAGKWAEQAVQKLSGKSVEVGRYDLVLHPTHLWLTIHESIAHPTELDRALGYEANYAGTSFVAPPEKMLGQFRYGPDFMNIQGDRSQEGACGSIGYDDEGVKPDTFLIIKNGIVNDYQTTREQAAWLKWWYDKQGKPARSHGCSNADSWGTVQFQRMPNVSLLPGAKDISYEDIIAATDRGIAIEGDGSFSIDQQRYNAQFGGQVFHEIKGGKIVGQLKDVAYQMRTPDFWNSMDMIGGKKSYFLGGAFNDGKGQPPQSNAISHGCVPSRFRNINVINTGRKA
ncbi:MAG TPA: TldD/PmbA family protein [Gemmatimonadaceae bacterium]|jgi:TldD protein|nr:TldD/PmbA family protein [Gemmatimonadaceae bacterium]